MPSDAVIESTVQSTLWRWQAEYLPSRIEKGLSHAFQSLENSPPSLNTRLGYTRGALAVVRCLELLSKTQVLI